jgi:peptidoglycan/LPS O-acetylase OafA/YrhL
MSIPAPGSSSDRILPFDGMRGAACLMVFFVHFYALFGIHFFGAARPWFYIASNAGSTGVDCFFVISGFLIYKISLERKTGYGSFIVRRVRRLYPTFLVVFFFYLILSARFPAISKLPDRAGQLALAIGTNILMLPGILPTTPIISVAWSLSYEWFFYLTLPLIVLFCNMKAWNWRSRIAFWTGVAIVQYLAATLFGESHLRLIMFTAGIILWEAVRHFPLRRPSHFEEWAAISTLVFALAVVGGSAVESRLSTDVLASVPNFYGLGLSVGWLLVAFYALRGNGILRSFFSVRALQAVGKISYSYYLIHGLGLHILKYLLPVQDGDSVAGMAALLTLSLAFTLSCGALLYFAVEKPLSLKKPARKPAARQLDVPNGALTEISAVANK